MFHRFHIFVTMISVVLHALLGCCVHHAHACGAHDHTGINAVGVTVVAAAAHHDGHDHRDHGDDDCHDDCHDDSGACDSWPADSDGDSCEEPNCNIVCVQRDLSVTLGLAIAWTPPQFDNLAVAAAQDVIARRAEVIWPPDRSAVWPPIRLQKQVWRL